MSEMKSATVYFRSGYNHGIAHEAIEYVDYSQTDKYIIFHLKNKRMRAISHDVIRDIVFYGEGDE